MTTNKENYSIKRKDISLGRISECLDPSIEIDTKYIIYFMNSLRSLLESAYSNHDRYDDYSVLNFFSNWCLHAKMDKSNYKNIMDVPEKYFEESNETRKKKGLASLDKKALKDFYMNFISEELLQLSKLRKQITTILKEAGLTTDLVEKDNKWWARFRKKLVEVLESSPYIINKDDSLVEVLVMEKDLSMEKSNPKSYVGSVNVFFNDGDFINMAVLDGTNKIEKT